MRNTYIEIPINGSESMSPKKIPELPRQTCYIDARGRVVIPSYMRIDLGLTTPGWVEIERYPTEGECKSLILKKG